MFFWKGSGKKPLGMTETLFAILPSDYRESRSLWHKPPTRGEWAVSVCQSNSRNKRSGKKLRKEKPWAVSCGTLLSERSLRSDLPFIHARRSP
jgi:hypothetical protein